MNVKQAAGGLIMMIIGVVVFWSGYNSLILCTVNCGGASALEAAGAGAAIIGAVIAVAVTAVTLSAAANSKKEKGK